MSKYRPLGDYLKAVTVNEISLTFGEIEGLLGQLLPPSARRHDAWWENSGPGDKSHVHARVWMDAGWRKFRADRQAGVVVFRRAGTDPDAEALDSLKPRRKQVIYDILRNIPISVDGWHWTKDGYPVEDYRSNPQFCYNWSFGSIPEGYALCLWHKSLESSGGVVFGNESGRDTALELERIARSTRDASARSRVLEQAARAWALDAAIRESYERGLPIRAIICDGHRRDREEFAHTASAVNRRFLDSELWYAHSYSSDTGVGRIVRGLKPDAPATSSIEDENDSEADDVVQHRAIKTRRGQKDFRDRLLSAYRRRCAVTGSFTVELLEAAHIIPHASVTDYSTRNGILLRADVHTLFDLKLLAIDVNMRIHISATLRHSEYWAYDGQQLKTIPERSDWQPSRTALEARIAEFRDAEANRR
ncbi:HNH endonuclease [Paraburkholderia sp. SIMBA_054]|uniref:HNH endonuclease n=1 Tax=Paraburkholderia sp. SIMBA_054 TaxID=3085795 RepID=UPI00397E62A2